MIDETLLDADRQEKLTLQESMQPVPSSGLEGTS